MKSFLNGEDEPLLTDTQTPYQPGLYKVLSALLWGFNRTCRW